MSQTIKTHIELSGMTCPACEKLITKRLSKIAGVTQVKVSLKDEDAEIEGSRKLSQDEIQDVLKDTQYQIVSIY